MILSSKNWSCFIKNEMKAAARQTVAAEEASEPVAGDEVSEPVVGD